MGGLLAAIKRMETQLDIKVTQENQPHPFIPEDFLETAEEVTSHAFVLNFDFNLIS